MSNVKNYHSYRLLTDAFNETFFTNKSKVALSQYCSKTLKIDISSDKKAYQFSEEEKTWLKLNYRSYSSYTDLTKNMNKVFNKNRKRNSIIELCTKRLKLKGMPNTGTYKKGNIKEQLPIGTIRKTSNGVTYVKVKDSYLSMSTGYQAPYWVPLQKKIYEDAYGEVDSGKMVIFLDCDRTNFDLSNLYPIDRRISIILASNKWYTEDAELTLTAIKWAELYICIN